MYTLSTCPWCAKAKKFFKNKGITFEYIDYDLLDEDDQAKIRKEIDGYGVERTFPVAIIGDEVITGYDPEQWAKILGL
jgi:glutaredoxin